MYNTLPELQAGILSAEQDYEELFQQTLDLLAKQMVEQRILERMHKIPSAYVAAKIKEWALEDFDGILKAKSKEELALFMNGSKLLLGKVREVLNLPLVEVNAKVVECLRYITELVVTTQADFASSHPDLFESCYFRLVKMIVQCPQDEQGSLRNLAQSLFELMLEKNIESFHRKQMELVETLNRHPEYIHPDQAKIAQIMQLLATQINGVGEVRNSYLESLVNYRHYTVGFAWILVGLIVMTATVFLSLGMFPAVAAALGITATASMITPAIVMGCGVLAYSIFDFTREIMSHFTKKISPIKPKTTLQSRVTSVLQLSGASIGIALATIGVIAAIPTLGVSLWVPLVMAGFSIFITTGFAAKLFYHYFVSKRSLENVEAACIDYNADKVHEIEQIIQQKPKSQMSTTIIDKELAGFSPDEKIDEVTLAELRSSLNQNTKTEPHSSHNMDDLAKLNEQTIETILRHAEPPTQASNDEQIIDDEGDGRTAHGPLK